MTLLRATTATRGWQPASLGQRPELAALVAVALAWPGVATLELLSGSFRVALAGGPSPFAAALAWAAMSAAMMGPVALPAARHVALNSLRRRRHRAVATFFASFVAVWVAAGLVIWLSVATWRGAGLEAEYPGLLFVVALGLAAAWQLTVWKRSALRSCQRTIPLAPRGWQATIGAARFGTLYAGTCVRSCWALMLVMATAGQAHLAWSLIVTVIVVCERFVTPVRRAPWTVAAGLAAIGLLAVAAVATGTGVGGPGAAGFLAWLCPIPGS